MVSESPGTAPINNDVMKLVPVTEIGGRTLELGLPALHIGVGALASELAGDAILSIYEA